MVNRLLVLFILCITLISCASTSENGASNLLVGPYLGQVPPHSKPSLFAPGIVSDGMNNRDMAITPDGNEIYYSVNIRNFDISTIMRIQQTEEGWSQPEVASFANNPNYKYLEPSITPDGSKFFFVASKRDSKNNNDIWVMERTSDGWGQARQLGEYINTSVSETFPSVTNDGTLYFGRASDNPQVEHIYRSRLVEGVYGEPEQLPVNVNSGRTRFNAYVAPNESYLILCVYGREDSIGSIDYYVVFRNDKDQWSEPVNMGDKINTKSGDEYSPYVSPDGKYFFFMSTRLPLQPDVDEVDYSRESLIQIHSQPENGNSDIYWIDASLIELLRPEGF